MIWGERERLAAIARTVAADPAVDQLLMFYDEPEHMEAGLRASWDAVRDGLADGAAGASAPALAASTLPELLQDRSAMAFVERGVPAVAGLRTALACVAALRRPPADPERLRAIAHAARAANHGAERQRSPAEAVAAASSTGEAGRWLPEAEAKALLAAHGVAVPRGRVVADAADAARAAAEIGGPVAVKGSPAELRHKTEAGALVLGVAGEAAVRAAYARVAAPGRDVLVEAMARPGVELLVAARRDAVVPALVIGLGGVWTEALGDVAVVPLPASPERVAAALRSLRGAPLLTGARGAPRSI